MPRQPQPGHAEQGAQQQAGRIAGLAGGKQDAPDRAGAVEALLADRRAQDAGMGHREVDHRKEAGDSLHEFLEDFPSVTRAQAVAALELAKQMLVAHANPA